MAVTERRISPRYLVSCAVQVAVTQDGNTSVYPATSINLSRSSMQLACKPDLISAILRQPVLPHTCQLEFALPGYAQQFRINAQVLTYRRVAQDALVLVVQFINMEAEQEALLVSALDTQEKIWPA